MDSLADAGPPPPCPARFNLARHVLAPARETPDAPALAIVSTGGGERWTFAALEGAVLGTAAGLLGAGLRPGDRLLLRLGHSADVPIAFLGAAAAGVLPVPTAAGLTAPEVERIAAELRPAAVAEAPGLATPAEVPLRLGLDDLRAFRDLPPARYADTGANDPAYIVFTSGSAGRPRGVLHAHRAVHARRMMWEGWYGLRPGDRLMHAGALNWTFTLGTGVLDPLAAGATALIPVEGTEPRDLPDLMRAHEATIFAAAPGVYRRMLRGRDRLDLPALRHGLSAGERMPDPVREAWERATGTTVHEAFGMSECSTFLSGSPARPAPKGAAGYAQPGRRVAILGPAGEPVPRGEPGAIAVAASDPGLMLGYLDAPPVAGAWFLTGDVGVMAEDGAVAHLGRADDMMNAGGHRVSPAEVEGALSDLAPCAAVELLVKADASVVALAYEGPPSLTPVLEARAAERLAPYKRPRLYRAVEALPRAGNGKLDRRALRLGFPMGA